jgi:alcohol dehydrogenase
MMGSLLAGMAFSNASLGLVHAMAHALGGLMDLPHGLCNALLLEEVVQFNHDAAPQRYRSIAQRLTCSDLAGTSDQGISEILKETLSEFRSKLDLPTRIDTAPVDLQLLTDLSNHALKDACLVTNPKHALQEDISGIFRKILP